MRTLREYIAKTSICAREHVQVCAHSQACTHTPMRHVRHAWPCAANQLSWALLPSATIDPVTCDTMPHGIPCRTGQASCRMGYLAEDDVLAIEPVARHHGDEELTTVQARSGHTRRWSALHTLRRRAARHRTNAARRWAGAAQGTATGWRAQSRRRCGRGWAQSRRRCGPGWAHGGSLLVLGPAFAIDNTPDRTAACAAQYVSAHQPGNGRAERCAALATARPNHWQARRADG
jgi:hypothetical protein